MKTVTVIVAIRSFILFFSVLLTHTLFAQVSYSSKLSPVLLSEINKSRSTVEPAEFVVAIKNGKTPIEILNPVFKGQKLYESPDFSVYKILATVQELDSIFLPLPEVIFIEK